MARQRNHNGRRGKDSKDDETKHLINAALLKRDVKELRQIASVRGLVSDSLRRRVWPLLLGVDSEESGHTEAKVIVAEGARALRDDATITVDIIRCLHQENAYVNGENREAVRARLAHLLRTVVDADTIYYYQGLHELASVLLLVVGDSLAHTLLQRMAVTHLRDNTRATLDATMEALALIFPLLGCVDHRLELHLRSNDMPPYFAISWLITWFAHDVKSVPLLARLYDFFLSTHPLMPLYVGAAAMLAERDSILAQPEMEDIHTKLVNLDITACGLSLDELTTAALRLMHQHPPLSVVRRAQMRTSHCAAIEAKLVDGVWWVPEKPGPVGASLFGDMGLNMWLRSPARGISGIARTRVVLSVVGITTVSIWAVFLAIMNSRSYG